MTNDVTQTEVKEWFNSIYRDKGFDYIRPIEAYELFATILLVKENSKHLDVACGLGLLLRVMSNHGAQSKGIDISSVAVQKAKQISPKSEVVQGNAESLPFEDESFDTISCIGSIERMLDRKSVLAEQYRVGKRNAKFIYMVRNSNHWLWKYIQRPFGMYNKEGHQDAMNLKEWSGLFEECGFKTVAVYPDHWPFLKVMITVLPFVKWDYSKIRKFPRPTHTAYELIFLLEKA